MCVWMLPEYVECIRLGEDIPADYMLIYFGISFKKWISIVMMILLFFLIVWFICLDINEEFEDLSIEVRELFDVEADSLIGQFEVNINMMYNEILSALRNIFMNESSMLDDDESYFALYRKKDPEKSIAWFFSKVKNRIDKVSSRYSCGKEDAELLYSKKLRQMDQRKSEPTPRYLNKLQQINQTE